MKKQILFSAGLFLILVFSFLVFAETENTQPSSEPVSPETQVTAPEPQAEESPSISTQETESKQVDQETQSIQENTKETEFNVDPGMTPDSPLYFIDNLIEKVSVGSNPERAMNYKEEKIAEAKAMVDKGKPEEAQKVLNKAIEYNNIVEKEVSPNIRDKVQESAEKVQYAINNMKENTKGEQWKEVNENFDKNLEKEKNVATAAELAAKIQELCETLSRLDPLQYADSCKSKDSSPKWIKEQDKELTEEQKTKANIFFDKLSQCFESAENCDCKGMGVQSFEDFCNEKSSLALKCEQGDDSSCKEMQSGSDPTELLPSYLIPVFKKIESKYSKSQFDKFTPQECIDANVKTPEECNAIMFKLNAPQECIDAGLTGESSDDGIECKSIMFEKNTPQECIDAGITSEDNDAPRKCAKIMFSIRAPQECIDAGLTGESNSDEKKCKQLMSSQETYSKEIKAYAPKFSKDCNSIQDTAEKVKCYEEFYNNAQVQTRDDFRETSSCQSQQQIESLEQDCKNRGQDAKVENRGNCPWVICIGNEYQTNTQQPQKSGVKCPDSICDDYEKMNPYACPEDCGGSREAYKQVENRIDIPQQQPIEQIPQQNRIDQPIQPQEPYLQREPQQQTQKPYQPPQECPGGVCQPSQEQIQQEQQQTPSQPAPESAPSEPASAPSSEPAPETAVTGSAITGKIIVSSYGDENTRDGDLFLDYWFKR